MAAFATGGGEQQLSGLAGEIRRSIESDQYDLANYTEQRVKDLMIAAFTAPLPGPKEMIRCTFIAGGGKLVRAKYSDDLPKWIISALRDIGFTEDRGAAETFDSQGTFKQQHDTGQNLKYLIVYPRVACATAGKSDSSAASSSSGAVALDTKTPEYMVSSAALDTFKQMVASKCESWRQKKRALKVLQDASETFAAIEAKLCAGQALDPREQALYESNSGADSEKIAWLQGEIKAMSESGRLTASEKVELLASIQSNLQTAEAEKAKATEENKPKLVEKITEKMNSINQRKEAISGAAAHQPRLRHGDEIQKCRVKLLALIALEERPKSSGALTIADLQTLSEKPEVEEAIAELEKASRGWFESEEDFSTKCAFESKEAKQKFTARLKASQKGGGGKSLGSGGLGSKGKSGATGTQRASSSSSSSSASWASIGVKRVVPKASGGGGGGGGGAKGGFAAAFADDDSEDEDD